MLSDDLFAAKMRKLKETAKKKAEEKARVRLLEEGRLDSAWASSYQHTVVQMGPPTSEWYGEGSSFYLSWEGAVVLDLGLVRSYSKSPSPKVTIMKIMENHDRVIQAPRTLTSFICLATAGQFKELYDLENWAEKNRLPSLRVLTYEGHLSPQLLIRSNGTTDWYGKETFAPLNSGKRPVVWLDIP